MAPLLQTLPEDIIQMEILTRLPVKSLLRFSTVCKLWKSLMSDPDFINSHLTYSTSQNTNEKFLLSRSIKHLDQDVYCEINIVSLLNFSETRLYYAPYMKHELQLIGSINGLVCLFSEKLHRFVIFNPATGQAKNIDVPDTVFKRYCPISISGFCWDAVKNDYKVIIPRTYGGIVPEDPFEISYFYSCKTDSWSTALNKFPFIKNIANCFWARSVIVNGMPYWTNTGFCKKKRAYEFYVIKFEPVRNEFKMLPTFVSAHASMLSKDRYRFLIVNLKEGISALVYEGSIWDSLDLVDVYCLDERCGTWTKMYTVDRIATLYSQLPDDFVKLSQCVECNNVVLFQARGYLMCFDQETKQIKGFRSSFQVYLSYNFSLVFLEGMKPFQEIFQDYVL